MTNSTPKYDVYYFIRKFAAIPENRWGTGMYRSPAGQMCALGHCGARSGPFEGNSHNSPEATALHELVDRVIGTNDGLRPEYQQSTPKKRILAALRDVACSQLPPEQEEKEA